MPRPSDLDAIASAVAYRLSRDREVSSSSSSLSRSAVSRISSAVAYTLAGGRGRGTSASGRAAESRIASAVAFRLRTSRRSSPIVARLARGGESAVSRRSVRRPASLIADRLAAQPEVRRRARVSVRAVASAVARRLYYSDQQGTFPVAAVASRVARLLNRRQTAPGRPANRRDVDALASQLARRLASREGTLQPRTERDPGRQPG